MENITEISYETIRKLILESEWGRAVRQEELFGFLFNEVYEFIDGCNRKDVDNMLEEASDVLMILLYIVIKNVDNQQNNQIEELLYRVNRKLQTRYSVFFDGNEDGEVEEKHWMKTKYMEKEILEYLYCPNPDCSDYAVPGRGNMMIEGKSVICRTCGHAGKYSGHNTLLYSVKYRRRLLNTANENYAGYLKGTLSYADDYFNGHRDDYLKIMRYWISGRTAGFALRNYFVSRHNTSDKTFDEFLLYPLRNFLKNMLGNQEMKLSRSVMEINDLMLKCVNRNYSSMKNRFCKGKSEEWEKTWIGYMGYLVKSMVVPVEYVTDDQLSTGYLNCQDTPLNMYNLYAVLDRGKKVSIFFAQFSTDNKENGGILKADLSECRKNTQVGRALLSVILKFNLQHISKMRCILSNVWKTADFSELSAFLRDILPATANIECE